MAAAPQPPPPPNQVPTGQRVAAPSANMGSIGNFEAAVKALTDAVSELTKVFKESSEGEGRGSHGRGSAGSAAARTLPNPRSFFDMGNYGFHQAAFGTQAFGPFGNQGTANQSSTRASRGAASADTDSGNQPGQPGSAGRLVAPETIRGSIGGIIGSTLGGRVNAGPSQLGNAGVALGQYLHSQEWANRRTVSQFTENVIDKALAGRGDWFQIIGSQKDPNQVANEKVQGSGLASFRAGKSDPESFGRISTAGAGAGVLATGVDVALKTVSSMTSGQGVGGVTNSLVQGLKDAQYATDSMGIGQAAADQSSVAQANLENQYMSQPWMRKAVDVLSQNNAIRRAGSRRLQGQHLNAWGIGAGAGLDINESISGAMELSNRFGSQTTMQQGLFKQAAQAHKWGMDVQQAGNVMGTLMQGGGMDSSRAFKEFEKVISTGIKAGMKDPQSWELAGNVLAQAVTSEYGAGGAGAVAHLMNTVNGQSVNMLQFQQGVAGVAKYDKMQDTNAWFRATNLETAKGILGESASWEAMDILGSADFSALAEHAKGGTNPLLKGAGISKEQASQQMEAQMQRYFDAAGGGNEDLRNLLGKHGSWKNLLSKEANTKVTGLGGQQTTVSDLMSSIMVSADKSFGQRTTFAENQQKLRVFTGQEGTQKGAPQVFGDAAHGQLGMMNNMAFTLEKSLGKIDWKKSQEALFGEINKEGKKTKEGIFDHLSQLDLDPAKFENAQKAVDITVGLLAKLAGIDSQVVQNIKAASEKVEKMPTAKSFGRRPTGGRPGAE
jgi:hypothetical protein